MEHTWSKVGALAALVLISACAVTADPAPAPVPDRPDAAVAPDAGDDAPEPERLQGTRAVYGSPVDPLPFDAGAPDAGAP